MGDRTYVGLDVHVESIRAVWGRVREELRSRTVRNDEGGIGSLLEAIGREKVSAVYEAGGTGFVLYDRLSREGWEVYVVAPTHLERSNRDRKRKTDDRDARYLQQRLVSHGELGSELPKVWIPPRRVREHRELIRRRLTLGERIGCVKVQIRSLLQIHGIRRPETIRTLWTKLYVAWLTGLCGTESSLMPAARIALSSQLRELAFMEKETEQVMAEVELLAESAEYREPVRRMTQVQGVGTLTAMVFLLELGDPNRFRNRRQLAAYLGLVPGTFESGAAADRKGHITRMGPPRIRKVLNQAAWAVLRGNSGWNPWHHQLELRRGKKKAIVAVMRKLGIKLWTLARTA